MPTVIIAGATFTQEEAQKLVEQIFPVKALWRPQGKGSTPMARFEGVDPIWVATVLPTLRVAFEEKEWDINVVPDGLSINEYRLLCIDLDSTLVETECLDILGDLVGRGDQMRTITQKAMTGKLRFEDSLRQRVELLKDSPASILEEALAAVKLSPGAEYLLDFVKSYGLDVWLFSGGLIELAAPIAERLGFAGARANAVEITPEGFFSGKLSNVSEQPVFNGEGKGRALLECCSRLDVAPRKAISIGDGANDLDMTKLAGLGVGYHAKPLLRGSTKEDILEKGYDKLKTYGVGKELNSKAWKEYLYQMLQLGYIEIDYTTNGNLKVTALGRKVLFGEQQAFLTEYQQTKEFVLPTKKGGYKYRLIRPDESISLEERLFDSLQQLRKQIAERETIPAYLIFSDDTLHDIVEKKPTSLEAFSTIQGVGELKLEKYGKVFVALIRFILHLPQHPTDESH